MLLAGIALLLAILVIMSSMNLYVNYRMKKQGEATRAAIDAQRIEIAADVQKYLENSQTANQDLIADYQRDRNAVSDLKEDYLLERLIVGNDYLVYALMLQTEQTDKLLELLAKMP